MAAVLDFAGYIGERTKEFTGREWVLAAIDRWLDAEGPTFFIITGEPGVGKTALAARLTQVRLVAAYHFCIARDMKTVDPVLFARSMAWQLCQIAGFAQEMLKESKIELKAVQNIQANYGQVIGARIETLVLHAPSGAAAFTHAVLQPLQALCTASFAGQLVLVVDALDEAVQRTGETVVDLLANAGVWPRQVRVVLTSRPEGAVLRHFQERQIPHLRLDAGHQKNLGDIRDYIQVQVAPNQEQVAPNQELRARLAEQGMATEVFVERVTRASRGNFLYLVWLLPAIAAGNQRFDTLEALPQGLDAIYREFLRTRSIGANKQRWRTLYRPILGVLTVAQNPLTSAQIAQFTGLSDQELDDGLQDLRQFFDPAGADANQYALYHQSVSDWLQDMVRSQEFWVEVTRVHEQIANHYWQAYANQWETCEDGYALSHLLVHLEGADQVDKIHHLLAAQTSTGGNAWYEAKAASGDLVDYLADVQRAWRLAEVAYSSTHHPQAARSIGHQCLYGCLISSINSLVYNLPSALLIALVDKQVWPWSRALPYMRFIPDLEQRFKAVLDLSPIEDAALDQWIEEIEKVAQEIKQESMGRPTRALPDEGDALTERETERWKRQARLRRAARLAARPPDLKPEKVMRSYLTIGEFLELGPEHNPYEWLLNEIPYLPKAEQQYKLNEILNIVLTEGSFLRENLVCLFFRIPTSLRDEVLAIVRKSEYLRFEILGDLILNMQSEERAALVQETMEMVFATKSMLTLADNVIRLAPDLYLSPSLLRQTLTAFYPLETDEPYTRIRKVKALAALAPYLSEQDRETAMNEALITVRGLASWRQEALAELIPHLSKSLLPEAVKIFHLIDDSGKRWFALPKLFPYLPDLERTQAWNLCTDSEADPLKPPFLHELGIEWHVVRTRDRLEALIEFAPVAANHEREIILQRVLAELGWIDSLTPGLLTQLVKAFPLHEHEIVTKLLVSAAQEHHIEQQAPMLIELLPFLTDELVQAQILQEALTKRTWNLRGERVIQRLAPLLPEKLVWTILRKLIPWNSNLWSTIPELHIHRLSDKLDLGFHLDTHEQDSIAFALMMRLAELGQAESAHKIAKEWKEEGLATLVLTRLPLPQLEAAFQEFVLRGDYPEEIQVPKFVVEQPKRKTDYSSQQRLSGSAAYEAILDEFCIRLAAAGDERKALTHAQAKMKGYMIPSEAWREKVLSTIVMYLDDKEEARGYAQAITAPLWRAKALLTIARRFKDEDQYKILGQAFEATLDIGDWEERWDLVTQLTSLIATWPRSPLYEIWKVILARLSAYDRQHMIPELCCLAPLLKAVGGPEAVGYTLQAIATVGHWWP